MFGTSSTSANYWACKCGATNWGERPNCRTCAGKRSGKQETNPKGTRRARSKSARGTSSGRDQPAPPSAQKLLIIMPATPAVAMSHQCYSEPPTDKEEVKKFRADIQKKLGLLTKELNVATELGRQTQHTVTEIAVYKRMLIACKAITEQINGAQEALSRAEKRAEEAALKVKAANAEHKEALAAVTSCKTALEELRHMQELEGEGMPGIEEDDEDLDDVALGSSLLRSCGASSVSTALSTQQSQVLEGLQQQQVQQGNTMSQLAQQLQLLTVAIQQVGFPQGLPQQLQPNLPQHQESTTPRQETEESHLDNEVNLLTPEHGRRASASSATPRSCARFEPYPAAPAGAQRD